MREAIRELRNQVQTIGNALRRRDLMQQLKDQGRFVGDEVRRAQRWATCERANAQENFADNILRNFAC